MDIDDKIRLCVLQKHELNRALDRKEITDEEFKNQLFNINTELDKLNKEKINYLTQKNNELFIPQTHKQVKQLATENILKELNIDPKIGPHVPIPQNIKPESVDTQDIKKLIISTAQVKKHTQKTSIRDLIIKALLHPKIDSEEKLLIMVDEWLQEKKHKEELRKQTRDLICLLKNNKIKKYKYYIWDKDKYILTETVQKTL
jgi:hypothetical protein